MSSDETDRPVIEAYCGNQIEEEGKRIAEYRFSVCAHAVDFFIDDDPGSLEGYCRYSAEKISEINIGVEWHWSSDSMANNGDESLQDLDGVVRENYPGMNLTCNGRLYAEQPFPASQGFSVADARRYWPSQSSLHRPFVCHFFMAQEAGHTFECKRCGKKMWISKETQFRLIMKNGPNSVTPALSVIDEELSEHGMCVQGNCDGEDFEWNIERTHSCPHEKWVYDQGGLP